MNVEVLRIVKYISNDCKVDTHVVFSALESVLRRAGRSHLGESEDVRVDIDRATGEIRIQHNGSMVDDSTVQAIASKASPLAVMDRIRVVRDAIDPETGMGRN